jgi:hypothetical protein
MQKTYTAGSIARERLQNYLDGKLKYIDDDAEWEVCTYLLEQAQTHTIEIPKYMPVAFQKDKDDAKRKNDILKHFERGYYLSSKEY